MARIEIEDRGAAAMVAAGNVLAPGEALLWTGWPRPWAVGAHNLPKFALGVPFAAVIFVFWGFFLVDGVPPESDSLRLMIWPIVITLAGLWLLSSPLWAALMARRLIYAITDRHLLIIGGLFSKRVRAYSATEIETIDCRENEDKSGNIVFRRSKPFPTRGFGILKVTFIDYADGFFGISDVRGVEALVRQLSQQGSRTA